MTGAAPLLGVQGLSKHFGGVRAVDNVDWSIGAGELRCIIGPNGAGKSTFFQLLVGRLRPDRGVITFGGRDVTQMHPFGRARLGIAVKPQTLGVFKDITVEHNLRLALQRVQRGARLEAALERRLAELDLSAKRDHLVADLSHGEKQWLGLGMAMSAAPKLVLLDEPTAGMTISETERTAALVREVAAGGVSVIVVEHDMGFVRDLATQTTVFNDGRVFLTGSISEIEQNEDVRRLYLGRRGAARLRQ